MSENKLARTETTTVTPLEPSAVWEDNDPSKSQIVAYPSSLRLSSSFATNENFVLGLKAWLPDGNSQIFSSYVFGPSSGFWTMAPLRYTAKFDPFLSLDCAGVEGVGAQILPSGYLDWKDEMIKGILSFPSPPLFSRHRMNSSDALVK